MAGVARRNPPDRPPERMNSKHVIDLYEFYISITKTPTDPERSKRPSQPIERQVLHKVIHRMWISETVLWPRARSCTRLAGPDTAALEWRVQSHAGRPRIQPLRHTARERRARMFRPHSVIFASLSILRRTALMQTPRIAHGAATPASCPSVSARRAPPACMARP